MTNFDIFGNNPVAALLVAKEGYCAYCPMYEKCDSAPDHNDFNKCLAMWVEYFKSSNNLESVNLFSRMLAMTIELSICGKKN